MDHLRMIGSWLVNGGFWPVDGWVSGWVNGWLRMVKAGGLRIVKNG